MNATKSTIIKISIALTSLAICAALTVFSTSCANSDDSSGSGGSGGGSTGSGAGGSNNPGTGGSSSTAGSGGGSVASGDTVTFSAGKASGAMTGYGWVALGALDSLTSPVCDATGATPAGTASQTITKDNACPEVGGKTVWSTDSALCITGSAPMVIGTDYTSSWGMQIGVNSTDPNGGVIPKTYSTVTFTFDGLPTPAGCVIRAEIHKKGDPADTTYCATAISGKALKIADFSTSCWDGLPGTFGADGGPANIDKIGLQVSGDTNASYTISNMCLHSIAFAM